MDMINVFKNGLPIFGLFNEFDEDTTISEIDLTFGHDDLNLELLDFLQSEVLPDYVRNMDKAHSVEHIIDVVKNSLSLADKLKCDKDIALTAAIYHDIGRCYSMEFNKNYILALNSIVNDSDLLYDYGLVEDDILTVCDAVVDLSPSSKKTTIYSKILSDADKISEVMDIDYLIKRYCDYVVAHYTYESLDKMIDRIYFIIHSRYKDKKSIGNIYYTDIAKNMHEENINNVIKISNNKKAFLYRLAELVEEENNNKKG